MKTTRERIRLTPDQLWPLLLLVRGRGRHHLLLVVEVVVGL